MDDKKININIGKLEAKCRYLSEREVKINKAERDSIKFMQCVYMNDNIGKVFKGIVSSVTEYGIFVEILENKSEGLIKLSEVQGDTYQADVNNHCIKGYNTGHKIRLGDMVHVIVSSVDIEKKNINLSLINF